MRILDLCGALACSLITAALAQTPPPASSMPDDSGAQLDCPSAMQQAELALERGQQVAAAKRWKDALPLLSEASGAFLSIAANCPAVAAQANKQGDKATALLRQAEAASSHQTECLPRLDKALDLEVKVAAARGEKGDPAQIERLLAEAENVWREAADLCHPPHKEKAEKSLAATVRARAANAELLSSGPACDAAWKSATSLGDYARVAWKEKRWDDAASLYSKAVLAWEGAADKCAGSRQTQALRKVEQTQIDAHNAEHCGPLWDTATDQTQQLRTTGQAVSATEKDVLSVKAEVAWRDAVIQCRGNPQSLARTNADAISRERGTPLPQNAMALYGSRKAPPPAIVTNQPVVAPVVASVQPAASAVAKLPAAAAVAPTVTAAAPKPAPAPVVTPASAPAVAPVAENKAAAVPAAPPGEVVLVAGDTTYRGAFTLERQTGAVSGNGTVEWTNGERYVGALVNGRKHGKGRFEWMGDQWYEDDWVDDQAIGYGVIRFAGGNRYEGAVKDGEPNGRGTQVFPSGDRYTGDFVRGVFHGQGTYAWKNGNRYEGTWNMGRKHGQGRLTWASGEGWEGEFQNDQQTDKGKNLTASVK